MSKTLPALAAAALLLAGCASPAPTAPTPQAVVPQVEAAAPAAATPGDRTYKVQATMVEYAVMLAMITCITTPQTCATQPSASPSPDPTPTPTPTPMVDYGPLTAVANEPTPVLLTLTPAPSPTSTPAPLTATWTPIATTTFTVTGPTPTPAPLTATAPTIAPVVLDLAAPRQLAITTSANRSSVTVRWSTDEAATGKLEATVLGQARTINASNGAFATAHSATISGLFPGMSVSFRVVSVDRAGNRATSATMSKRTSLF